MDVPESATGLPVGLHVLEMHVVPRREQDLLKTAKESMDLHRARRALPSDDAELGRINVRRAYKER
jgi:hypothetical protein